MLDIHLLRDNPEAVRANLARRRAPDRLELLDRVVAWDAEWRRGLQELQELRHRRNAGSQEIARLVKEKKDVTAQKLEAAGLPDTIKVLETRVDDLRSKTEEGLLRIPNLLDESVPDGAGPEDNGEI